MANQTERLAKRLVFEFERKNGRKPRDVSGRGYDIESSGRFIEIKARSVDFPKGVAFFISKAQYKMLRNNKKFYIYVVYNLDGKAPKLKIIHRSDKPRTKVEIHYRMRFRKDEWGRLRQFTL